MNTLKNQLENSNKEKVNIVDAITKALKREKMLKKDLVAYKKSKQEYLKMKDKLKGDLAKNDEDINKFGSPSDLKKKLNNLDNPHRL